MKDFTDGELARLLLERRQLGGRTRCRYAKTSAWRWFGFFGFTALLLGLGTFVQAWVFCGFVVGLVTGVLSRNGVWFRQQRAAWPFYTKVIDWEEVERIAEGEPAV